MRTPTPFVKDAVILRRMPPRILAALVVLSLAPHAFADAVRANDAKIRSEMDARRQAFLDARAKAKETGERPERPSHALPDRMAEHLDMMEKRIADMKAMQPKILALYKTLDDTQKAKADRLLMMRG